MGRCGSFTASTWRSNQSFTAWLMPHTIGPASSRPASASPQRSPSGAPEDATPQPKAQTGGNQVTGLSSSSTAAGAGTDEGSRQAAGMARPSGKRRPPRYADAAPPPSSGPESPRP